MTPVQPAEVMARRTREMITRAEPELHAWVTLCDDYLEQARRVDDADKPLALRGVSVGVKDLIDVAGSPTRAGSAVTDSGLAAADAPCVARLRELGAVIQGKTVTTEFGYFAPGPTHNPHAAGRTPGGSSSGSAAVVGAGTVALALGTQTAGSLTRPAAYCGTAGMVLAHGAASLSGVAGLSESLDSLGMLTASVDYLERVYWSFVGKHPAPLDKPGTAFVWSGSELDAFDPAMLELIGRLPDLLRLIGVTDSRLDWDDQVRTLTSDHAVVMSHEAAATLDTVAAAHGDRLSGPLRQLISDGRGVTSDRRLEALAHRDRARSELWNALGADSVIAGPAALGPAPMGLESTGSPVLSRCWQFLGAPVVVVPGARTRAGLPLGIQLVGRPGDEHRLFWIGRRLERVLRALPPIA